MKSGFSTAAQNVSHPNSEYAPVRGIFHRKNPTSGTFRLPRRKLEGVGLGVTTFTTDGE